MTNATYATVDRHATQKAALPANRLTLIGLFGPQDALQGMVRLASGRVQTVRTGDRLATLGRIVAIDAKGLLIARGGDVGRLPVLAE